MQRNGQILLAGAVGIGILFFAGCIINDSAATPTPSSGTIAFNSVVTTVTPTTETSGTTASVSVSRMNGSAGAVSVGYATTDNTAIAGTDYIAASGKLSWADGDSSVKNIPISTAVQFSGSRSFSVVLSAPTGGAILGKNPTATVDITGLWIPPSTLSQSQFDFTNWKLMLPIDINGGTGGSDGIQYPAKEIQPTEIKAGYVDAYFYADASGQVIFTAPSNGAVSTPGAGPADHTRSELRELYTGPKAVSKDWNSSITGFMKATVAIKSIAAKSDVVTIGQIHGQDNTFMLLLYRKLKKDVVVDIYATNPPTTTPPAHRRTPILTGVEMGDTINYSIRYSGDTITTKAEDVTTQSGEQTLVSPIDPSWAGTLVYFKVGAYHSVPNTGNPDGDQTRVSVSAISVSH